MTSSKSRLSQKSVLESPLIFSWSFSVFGLNVNEKGVLRRHNWNSRSDATATYDAITVTAVGVAELPVSRRARLLNLNYHPVSLTIFFRLSLPTISRSGILVCYAIFEPHIGRHCKIFASLAAIVYPVSLPRLALSASHAAGRRR